MKKTSSQNLLSSENTKFVLYKWFRSNLGHPYPSKEETISLAIESNLTSQQVTKWFINQRKRVLKKPDEYSRLPSCISDDNKILLEFYVSNNFPNKNEKKILAANTNMSYDKISCWFAKRRLNEKKVKIKFFLIDILKSEINSNLFRKQLKKENHTISSRSVFVFKMCSNNQTNY